MSEINLLNLARAVDILAGIPYGAGYEADMRTALRGDLKGGTDRVVDNIRHAALLHGYVVVNGPAEEDGEPHYLLQSKGAFAVVRRGKVLGFHFTEEHANIAATDHDGAVVIDVTDTFRKYS